MARVRSLARELPRAVGKAKKKKKRKKKKEKEKKKLITGRTARRFGMLWKGSFLSKTSLLERPPTLLTF